MTRAVIAAWLLVAVVVLVVAGALVPALPAWVAGLVVSVACALLAHRIPARQRKVVGALLGAGAIGIGWGVIAGRDGLIVLALSQNAPLIGMLIAVTFLQLISVAPGGTHRPLERGKGALARTLAGVHLFGTVINFSAVVIFADRLSARSKLTLDQAAGLTQAFIIGALWSPFYGAMAVALTVSPGASLTRLVAVGLPLTLAGVLLTYFTIASARRGGARAFEGYPVRFEALWVPAVLAASVLVVHEWRPAWSVMAVIAALAPLVTFVTLLAREGGRAWPSMRRLVEVRLPETGGEIALFLAAAVLSAGMTGALAALELGSPFRQFGGFEASVVFAAIVLSAWIGLHPVILCSVAGPWLVPLGPDPTLLAMTFIMAWGVGLTACPLSNTLLAVHGRYGIPMRALLDGNRAYSAVMAGLCIAVLNAYAAFATGG